MAAAAYSHDYHSFSGAPLGSLGSNSSLLSSVGKFAFMQNKKNKISIFTTAY